MRNKYLYTKVMLATFLLSTTACSFKLNPMSDMPATTTSTIASLSETVDSYPDETFTNSVIAETLVDDLIDESEGLGYELEACTLVRVVDGDTLVVDYNGEQVKVRLIGVNTPESVASKEYLERTGKENTEEGKTASEWVKDLLKDYPTLYLQKDTSETDRYGRTLRYVWLEVPTNVHDINEIRTKMLNGVLLDEGLAEVTIYKPDTKYADAFQAIFTHMTDEYDEDFEH